MALTKKQNANGWYYEGDASDFNLNKGITTGLDSSATVKPQPSGTMNSGDNTIPGANPSEPSTNNATRREKYNIENQGYTVPESTKIGVYDTVSPIVNTDRGTNKSGDGWNEYTGYIKKISGNSFITSEAEQKTAEVRKYLQENGIDATKEVYGSQITDAVNQLVQAEISKGQWTAALKGVEKDAPNVRLVETLTKETWMGIAQGKSIQEIAQQLGQDPRVIQKIANGEQAELIQLSQEYEDEQMRNYLRNKEDMDTQIARNITQYKNIQTNLDYQFNSAITTLERSLFDSEWTARGTAAGMGMTGTKYLLDRIKTQYEQNRADLQNTYDYQSANAQIAINEALEDYTRNVNRWMEDYATQIKGIQQYVLQEYMTDLNNVGLSTDQKFSILSNIKKNIEEMKANAIVNTASLLEDGNNSAAQMIANAYGLNLGDLTTHQFTASELGRTSTSTIGNDTNNLGHILSSDDGMRIGTYKSPNGYTYNVYATREQGLLATQGLLEKAYYGKTLRQAAQKRIGQGKDISGAVSVMKGLGLDPNAVLSGENVRQFMEAIGRWEGTIKKGETLDDWLKGGQDLSGYATSTTTSSEDMADAQKKIEDADDMIKKLQQFKKEYNSFDPNATINTYLGNNLTTIELRAKGIKTMGQLFTVYTNESDPMYSTVNALVSGNPQLGSFISAKRTYQQIKNLNFINNLIDAKSRGATFGNLTEGEGERIVTAYNDIIPGLPSQEMNDTIDKVIKETQSAINKLGQQAGMSYTSTNPTPNLPDSEQSLQDTLSYIGTIVGTGTTGTGSKFSTGTQVNTSFYK